MCRVIEGFGSANRLGELTGQYGKILLVCDGAFEHLTIRGAFDDIKAVRFSDIQPNPDISSVVDGISLFRNEGCDCIVSVGGGSPLDVAKCIKLYANSDLPADFLSEKATAANVPLIAVPTTAGTGSEATRFAVVYVNGVKQSVASEDIIPDIVILDPDVLSTLPDYQRKATMLDALCHALESYWSVNSTGQSRLFSEEAAKEILRHMDSHLNNLPEGSRAMLLAANTAGKAINITQTTAGHAMSYKLTSMFGLAHGHAAALCLPSLLRYMADAEVTDTRGGEHLRKVLHEIAELFGSGTVNGMADKFEDMLRGLGLRPSYNYTPAQLDELVLSVNPDRLKNTPVLMNREVLYKLYREVLT